VIVRDGDRLQVSGPLTLDTAKTLYETGVQLIGRDSLVVDMSGVEAVDSCAVSLMLNWLRAAQRNNARLVFAHVPPNLLSLAHLYGVAEMLPLSVDVSLQS
jgi:phospholipid transport system transporter-binding protein